MRKPTNVPSSHLNEILLVYPYILYPIPHHPSTQIRKLRK